MIDRFNNNTVARQITINFIFDETGVSSIKSGSNSSYTNLVNTNINIDGSAYTGGPATFELIDYRFLITTCPNVTFTGLGIEGVDYTFSQSINADKFTLTILTDRSVGYGAWDLRLSPRLQTPIIRSIQMATAYQQE